MHKFLFNSRNPITKHNYTTRTTWNYHNNNTTTNTNTNTALKATLLNTKSPPTTKRTLTLFNEDTKNNNNQSSSYTTPSLTKKTISYFKSPTNRKRELDGIRLNVALLRNKIQRLDTIVNDANTPTAHNNNKPQVKKHISVLKLNNPTFTIPPNKTLSNLSTPRNNNINQRNPPLQLISLKKDKNNKHNKISTFSIDYPVSLTEGNDNDNVDVNESKHKRRISEYLSKPKTKKVMFIPSKEATINYIMSDKTKKTKSFI